MNELLFAHGLVPHECATVKPGNRFGRLEILAVGKTAGTYNYRAVYRCDCGTVRSTAVATLQTGQSKSCGCLVREKTTKHGLHKSPLYRVWVRMHQRCYDPKIEKYPHYGGRGITVCERWHDVTKFHEDMSPLYRDGLWLDRIDNDGPYSPENCRWTARSTQQRNKRNNIVISFNGRSQVLQDWCDELGIRYGLVWDRIRAGWEPVKALSTPARAIRRR